MMNDGGRSSRLTFIEAELELFKIDRGLDDIASAWLHLERVHIVAQPLMREHILSHCRMLAFAAQQGDWPEVSGQFVRLILAPIGNLAGRLPLGNTGRARINAFAPMPFPADLERFR